jgi:hypothetical protein
MNNLRKSKGFPRLVSIAVTILPVMLVSACGKSSVADLSSARIGYAVEGAIAQQRGLRTAVVCPSKIPRRAGYVFTCSAQLDVGAYPVVVTETDGQGHVRYENRDPLNTLNVAKVQQAIWLSTLRQRHLRSTVTCPAEVLQQAGVTFTCTAVISGKGYRYPFAVREVDGKGHVQYLGR